MIEIVPDSVQQQIAGQAVTYTLRPEHWGAWSAATVTGYRPKSAGGLTATVVVTDRTRYADGRVEEQRGLSIAGGIAGARYQVQVGDLAFQVKVTAK